MCTAINETGKVHLFGRTLDLEGSYGEKIVITPRNFQIPFCHKETSANGYAIIGTAHVSNNFPLYFDAVNERGLCVAALNFPKFAHYFEPIDNRLNLASYELPLMLLRNCDSISSATKMLKEVNITSKSFNNSLPCTPLHWLIGDGQSSISLESTSNGLNIYENKFGVLTNSPGFDYHKLNLSNFMSLSTENPQNLIYPNAVIEPYSRGLGGLGLPGDFSSASRFVKAVFVKSNTAHSEKYSEEISRFFHVLESISQPLGCVKNESGLPVSTIYTSCADVQNGIYYFTTYNCRRIRGVKLKEFNLDSEKLIEFSMEEKEDIKYLN